MWGHLQFMFKRHKKEQQMQQLFLYIKKKIKNIRQNSDCCGYDSRF